MEYLQKISKIQFKLFFIELSVFLLVILLLIYQKVVNLTESSEYYDMFDYVKTTLIVLNGFFGTSLLTINHIKRGLQKEYEKMGDDSI